MTTTPLQNPELRDEFGVTGSGLDRQKLTDYFAYLKDQGFTRDKAMQAVERNRDKLKWKPTATYQPGMAEKAMDVIQNKLPGVADSMFGGVEKPDASPNLLGNIADTVKDTTKATLNEQFVEPSKDLWYGHKGATQGIWHQVGNASDILRKLLDEIGETAGLPKNDRPNYLKNLADEVQGNLGRELQQETAGRTGFWNKLYQGIGAAPLTVAEYGLAGEVLGTHAGAFGIIDALREADKGTKASLEAGAKGTMTGGILYALGPLKVAPKALLAGGTFASQAARDGGDIDDIATSFLVGAGLVASGARPGQKGIGLKEAVRDAVDTLPKIPDMRAKKPGEVKFDEIPTTEATPEQKQAVTDWLEGALKKDAADIQEATGGKVPSEAPQRTITDQPRIEQPAPVAQPPQAAEVQRGKIPPPTEIVAPGANMEAVSEPIKGGQELAQVGQETPKSLNIKGQERPGLAQVEPPKVARETAQLKVESGNISQLALSSSMHPEMKAMLEKANLSPEEQQVMMAPDILITKSGVPPRSRVPIIVKGYRGKGKTKAEIYAEGIEEAALGRGEYWAVTQQDASRYGSTISEKQVTLKNPLVITNTDQLSRLVGNEPVPYENQKRIAFLKRARQQVDAMGHDGVIINIPQHADMDANGKSVKRLREIFSHTQIVILKGMAREQRTRETTQPVPKPVPKPVPTEPPKPLSAEEKLAIQDAIDSNLKGKRDTAAVPPEVLADYPELAEKAAPKVEYPPELLEQTAESLRKESVQMSKEAGNPLMDAIQMEYGRLKIKRPDRRATGLRDAYDRLPIHMKGGDNGTDFETVMQEMGERHPGLMEKYGEDFGMLADEFARSKKYYPMTKAEAFKAAKIELGRFYEEENPLFAKPKSEGEVEAENFKEVDRFFAEVKPLAKSTSEFESKLSEINERKRQKPAPVGLSTETVKSDDIKGGVRFSDTETEIRYRNATKGVKPQSLAARAKEGIRDWFSGWKEFKDLPTKSVEYAELKDGLRVLQAQKEIATRKTLEAIEGVTYDLGPNKADLFTRKLLLDDLAYMAETNKDLPFGFTKESLTKDKATIDKLVEQNPDVAEAVKLRTEFAGTLRNQWASAMKEAGWENAAKRMTNPNYFRHMVMEYAESSGLRGAGNKLKTPRNRGWLKRRMGSELDINANYVQAEFEVWSQMMYDIEVAKLIGKVRKAPYQISGELKAEAKRLSKERGEEVDWHDLVPDTHDLYQPTAGNVFYLADTVSSRVARELLKDVTATIEISAEDLGSAIAKGQRFEELALPKEVIATLESIGTTKTPGAASRANSAALRAWKVWQLLSPRRLFKFNARNLSGDAEHLAIGNAKAFLKVPQAIRDLWGPMVKNTTYTGEAKEWMQRGGTQSLFRIQEMGELLEKPEFKRLYEWAEKEGRKPSSVVSGTFKGYWKVARLSTDFREAILRYAAYLDYLESIEKTGKPKNYGASVKEHIDGLSDPRSKAFSLSNDLLGAYDRTSVNGQIMSQKHWPFWRWQEANMKIYYGLLRNAKVEGKKAQAMFKLAGITVPVKVATKLAPKALLLAGIYSAVKTYNRNFFPDEEDALPEDIRGKPHIIIGTDKDGKIQYFGRIGAMQDILDWLGTDEDATTIDDWQKGRITYKEALKEMAVNAMKGTTNKVVQGVNPFYKLAIETITKQSFYPDVFSARPVRDRAQHVAQSFGVANEYNALTSKPDDQYKETLPEMFYYKIDPDAGSYIDLMEMKRRFLKRKDKAYFGFGGSPKSDALYNWKLSRRYDRPELAKKYLNEYFENGGTPAKAGESLNNAHPLKGMSAEDVIEFKKGLTTDEHKRLEQAIKYWDERLLPSIEERHNTNKAYSEYLRKKAETEKDK